MKTLLITREYPPYVYGGAGVHVEYLSRELAKLMEVEVRPFGDQLEENSNPLVFASAFENPLFDESPSQLKSALLTMAADIAINGKKIDADVVHCHTWYAHFAGILAKICYGIPLVITTHSLEPLRPWKREQLGRGYDLSSWVEKTALEMADSIIAVSQGTKEDILKYFNVDESKIKVIYNGIDLEQYQLTEENSALLKYGVDASKPYILFVGRITRQKGIVHLANAIKYLPEDTQVVLCAGAPDTEEIAAELKAKIDEVKKTHKNVIWIEEMLDKPSVIQMYSHAAVFCCPSIYEPFGIINLEAMACKTAVVASKVGGIKEVVVDGETGILVEVKQLNEAPFEPEDPESFAKDLATALLKVLNDDALRKSMEEKGRKRVEDVFSWSAIAKEVKDLYENLIASG